MSKNIYLLVALCRAGLHGVRVNPYKSNMDFKS